MPIQVSCSCGKRFNAQDEWAGRTAKCPGCGQPIQIPSPQQPAADAGLGDLFSEAGMEQKTGKTCPGCGKATSEEAVLCIDCGYNFETGQKMATLDGSGLKVGASETDKMLAKAADEIDSSPVTREEGYGSAAGAWLMVLVLGFGLGVGVLLLYAGFKWVDTAPDPNLRAAVVMGICGWFMLLIGRIWLIIMAFKQSVLQGVLVWFCPCYDLIYIFTNFGEAMVPAILYGVGLLMYMVASAMQAAM